MRRFVPLWVLLNWTPCVALAQHVHAEPVEGASIVVTINPEARVNAFLSTPVRAGGACPRPMTLRVKVVNQGGLTVRLRARLIDAPPGVSISLEDAALSGGIDELRSLHLSSDAHTPVDLTVAFSIGDYNGDLANRDRVHIFLPCGA